MEAAILTQTIEELAAHGLDGLSVERVAHAAEVNKTTIYRRWASKEALAVAALERTLDDMTLAIGDTGSLRGDLTALAEALSRQLETPAGRALSLVAISESTTLEVAALAQRRLGAAMALPIASLIERASSRGEWRTELSPVVVFGCLVGALQHRALFERQPLDAGFVHDVVDLVVEGAKPRPQTSGP